MKTFIFDGKTYDKLPGLLRTSEGTISPVTEALFVALGGIIEDDGKPSPKEVVISSLNTLLRELEGQVQGITIAEFKAAAASMHSGDLVAYARTKGVSEEIIASARTRVIEIMADALREGIGWAELIGGITAEVENSNE